MSVCGVVRTAAGGVTPPKLWEVAIAFGLRNAASQPIGGIADAAVGALVKVTQLLPPRLRNQAGAVATAVSAPAGATEEVALDTLATFARTRRDNERLRFTYRDAAGTVTGRHVEPHHVVPLGRRWYVVCWDLDRIDWRTFRLDRIDDPR